MARLCLTLHLTLYPPGGSARKTGEAGCSHSKSSKSMIGPWALALECAACPDIAELKQFVTRPVALDRKKALCEVVKMLVGLRKSWAENKLHEGTAPSVGRSRVGTESHGHGHGRPDHDYAARLIWPLGPRVCCLCFSKFPEDKV